ncbi:gb [Venturia nashicola]|nr:gb [Venturia nashicola]
MASEKVEPHAITNNHAVSDAPEMLGTSRDQKDMYRMGKVQLLKRNFSFWSIFGFSIILLSTWETQLGVASLGLLNGGSAGLVIMYLIVFFGMMTVILSMAEMASMAPTAGGQYHWVSEFAPPRDQRFLSYIVGWLCVLGWQSGAASQAFLAGSEIEGLLILNYPEHTYGRAHGTGLVIGVIFICGLFNTLFAHRLPAIEKGALFLHIAGFFGIMVTLLALTPKKSSHEVFTTFHNNGWSSNGVSCLVGMVVPVLSLLGADAATHMSEELKDASRTLPKAMISSLAINGAMGFGMLLTFLFCLGDMDAALSTPTGFAFIEVFSRSTMSTAAATGMTSIMIVLSTLGCITNMASASRQLFSFARDNAVPFPNFFAHVPEKWQIPLASIVTTVIISILLSLINIGSSIAFNQICSLGLSALLTSYLVSIACIALKRWRKEPLLKRSFDLGRWGLAINIISMLFLALIFVICFFPPSPNPAVADMNWAILIYSSVVIFALMWFAIKARKVYVGPITYVRSGT